MIKVNDEINVKIEKLSSEGTGIARYDGIVIFVEQACPDDELKIKIISVKKTYATGKIIEIIKPSAHRVEPFCKMQKVCGACQIQFINYGEASYDFGVFGNVDIPLSTNYYAAGSGGATITDNSYKLACNTSTYNTSSPQTITYEIEAGEHSVYIKYSKDDATGENNDTLQFKVTSIETLEPTVGYYTYDLNNISQSHSLIFIFGDVTYYFVTSNTNSDAKLYPNGQMVALPGDDYRLTIVPEKSTDTISLTDNGTDVTGNLERKEVQTEKEGQTITTVNYIYRLTNIQAAHTLNVLTSGGQILSVMSGGTWVSARKVFKRDERGWSEVNNYENLFESGKIYIPKRG